MSASRSSSWEKTLTTASLSYPADIGIHLIMPPVQEPVQGKGAKGGHGFPDHFPQLPVGRAPHQVPQGLMGQFVADDQGQFIIIEAETDQPLGQDDFPRRRVGIDFVILGVDQDGVLGRQVLGIEGKA